MHNFYMPDVINHYILLVDNFVSNQGKLDINSSRKMPLAHVINMCLLLDCLLVKLRYVSSLYGYGK